MKSISCLFSFLFIFFLTTTAMAGGPVLSGNYIMCSFGEEVNDIGTSNQSSDDPAAAVVALNLDDPNNGIRQELYVSSGTPDSGTFSYSISNDGLFMVSTSYGTPIYGVVKSDGTAFAAAEISTDDPFFNIAIQKSSGMSLSSLSGNYLMVQFLDEITPQGSADSPMANIMAISANGLGGGTYQILYSSAGESDSGPFTYSVAADGSLTIDGKDHGVVSADGSLFAIAPTQIDSPAVLVGIKKSTGLSNTIAKGEYVITQFQDFISQPGSADSPEVGVIDIKMDGNGNGTYNLLYSSSGEFGNGTFTYQVLNDGGFILYDEGFENHGVISSDGSMFAIALTRTDDPGIVVGIKKTPTAKVNLVPQLMLLE